MTDGSGEEEQIAQRRARLATLRAAGFNFPNDFRRTVAPDGRPHSAAVLDELFAAFDKAALAEQDGEVAVAGRLMNVRGPFLVLQDGSGRIQAYLDKGAEPALRAQVKGWDSGDIVAVRGGLERSGRGDLYVHIEAAELLCKALRPLPASDYYGLEDQEMRYRQRYADLMVNADSRRRFEQRSLLLRRLREFFHQHDFIEVETPMMHPIPGGASARPFVTHHNSLDVDLYLRVAPELYLKRLVVGGFERVFEVNRNFRNEGLSPRHNPEFTMLEWYQAYADYSDLMDFTEALIRDLALAVCGTLQIEYQGAPLDLEKPFARISVRDILLERAGIPEDVVDSPELLANHARGRDVAGVAAADSLGALQFLLFEELVEGTITDPVFVTRYPVEVSPLARRNNHDPAVADRFELFIMGREVCNGFSELNDAEDQAGRFRRQMDRHAAGDSEAMRFDSDYITALEYGMPPTAGEGLGVDRLLMLLTDAKSIRDVLLFPQLRPRDDG